MYITLLILTDICNTGSAYIRYMLFFFYCHLTDPFFQTSYFFSLLTNFFYKLNAG